MKRSIALFLIFSTMCSFALAASALYSSKGTKKSINECKTPTQPRKCHHSDVLTSKNNQFYGLVKEDGCFAIYKKKSKQLVWETCKIGQKPNTGCAPRKLTIRRDGNAVITDCKKQVVWKTKLRKHGKGPFRFRLTNKGESIIIDARGKKIWPNCGDHC